MPRHPRRRNTPVRRGSEGRSVTSASFAVGARSSTLKLDSRSELSKARFSISRPYDRERRLGFRGIVERFAQMDAAGIKPQFADASPHAPRCAS